ncbi:MAG: hypothetical protein WC588_03175, partial [Candidatus Micrarchaeia archaeon]
MAEVTTSSTNYSVNTNSQVYRNCLAEIETINRNLSSFKIYSNTGGLTSAVNSLHSSLNTLGGKSFFNSNLNVNMFNAKMSAIYNDLTMLDLASKDKYITAANSNAMIGMINNIRTNIASLISQIDQGSNPRFENADEFRARNTTVASGYMLPCNYAPYWTAIITLEKISSSLNLIKNNPALFPAALRNKALENTNSLLTLANSLKTKLEGIRTVPIRVADMNTLTSKLIQLNQLVEFLSAPVGLSNDARLRALSTGINDITGFIDRISRPATPVAQVQMTNQQLIDGINSHVAALRTPGGRQDQMVQMHKTDTIGRINNLFGLHNAEDYDPTSLKNAYDNILKIKTYTTADGETIRNSVYMLDLKPRNAAIKPAATKPTTITPSRATHNAEFLIDTSTLDSELSARLEEGLRNLTYGFIPLNQIENGIRERLKGDETNGIPSLCPGKTDAALNESLTLTIKTLSAYGTRLVPFGLEVASNPTLSPDQVNLIVQLTADYANAASQEARDEITNKFNQAILPLQLYRMDGSGNRLTPRAALDAYNQPTTQVRETVPTTVVVPTTADELLLKSIPFLPEGTTNLGNFIFNINPAKTELTIISSLPAKLNQTTPMITLVKDAAGTWSIKPGVNTATPADKIRMAQTILEIPATGRFNDSTTAAFTQKSLAVLAGGQPAVVTGGQPAVVTGGQPAVVTGGQPAVVTGGQ